MLYASNYQVGPPPSAFRELATLNPADKSSFITLSGGNLVATWSSSGANEAVRGTIGLSSGKYYFEVTCTSRSASANMLVGLARAAFPVSGGAYTSSADVWFYHSLGTGSDGYKFNSGGTPYGATWTTGDVIGVAANLNAGRIWWSKNGAWQASGNPETGANPAFTNITGTVYPCLFRNNNTADVMTCNFGQTAFAYAVPAGFLSGWGK